ncbi:MAG TPA: DUF3037 domain-containing protein [Solirubrobacterales bacterium]|nr:DUF3037 domain-containing protein [Solirubrobacterales bacterium]
MPASPDPFSYAIVRVVPDVERGESLNAGVILHSPARRFLAARVDLDESRLQAIAPTASPSQIKTWLDALVVTAEGRNLTGPLANLSQSERFGLLTAPSSTVIQASPVHTGLTDSPEQELQHLFERLVTR